MPLTTQDPPLQTLSHFARSRAQGPATPGVAPERMEPPAVLEYRSRSSGRRSNNTARVIEISGGFIFIIGGVGLICTFLSDDNFFHLPAEAVIRAFLLILVPLLFGGACCVCGGALRRGEPWAGTACAALLVAIDALWLVFLSVLLYRLLIGPLGTSLGSRLIELALVVGLATFHSVLLTWVIRDEIYPRWRSERVLW